MKTQNAQYLQTFAKAVRAAKGAKLETVSVEAIDFECLVSLAQSSMHEAEMFKSLHCHHGHGPGAHQHGQQTCIECAGIITYLWDFSEIGLFPTMTPEKLKQHYVGRMVYGEAYKG